MSVERLKTRNISYLSVTATEIYDKFYLTIVYPSVNQLLIYFCMGILSFQGPKINRYFLQYKSLL